MTHTLIMVLKITPPHNGKTSHYKNFFNEVFCFLFLHRTKVRPKTQAFANPKPRRLAGRCKSAWSISSTKHDTGARAYANGCHSINDTFEEYKLLKCLPSAGRVAALGDTRQLNSPHAALCLMPATYLAVRKKRRKIVKKKK